MNLDIKCAVSINKAATARLRSHKFVLILPNQLSVSVGGMALTFS